jgi:mycoredoxin
VPDTDGGEVDGEAAVTVYWRPGCFFCSRLVRGLRRDGVVIDLRNIWEDDEARSFVREHNRGNETVPTVAVGGRVWTNPDAATVTSVVRAAHPHLLAPDATGRGRRGRRPAGGDAG